MEKGTTITSFPAKAATDNAAFELAPLPLALIDTTTGRISACNTAFRTLFPESGRFQAKFSDNIFPDDRTIFETALLEGRPAEIRIGSGQSDLLHWVLMVSAKRARQDGSGEQYVIQLAGIDAPKQLEAAARKEADRWNNALISSELGVWDHNLRTGEKYYSPIWHMIRGYPPDSPLQWDTTEEWIERVHPHDQQLVRNAIQRQSEGDPDFMNFQYRERHRDGHWMWIECRGDCVEYLADGRPARTIGTDRDISDRKYSEELLTLTRRRLELALETSLIGVFERNLETNEFTVDRRICEIYGLRDRPEKIPYERLTRLIHGDDVERTRIASEQLEPGGPSISYHFRIFREIDGAIRHIHNRIALHPADDGSFSIIGVNWDVTEEMRLRQDLVTAKQLAEARNFELESARTEIEQATLHDYLTGLPNRHFLDQELARRITIAQDSGYHVALMHIDIDDFRSINDNFGYNVGDTVIKQVGRVILANSRHNDFVARINSDAFALVCSFENDSDSIGQWAERLLLELSKPFDLDGERFKASACIGIATTRESAGGSGQHLLRNAETALGNAKSQQPNTITFFTPETQRSIIDLKRRSDALMEAIEEEAFVPFYQPQFDARTMELCGLEALARWQKSDGSIGEPASFIPLAENLNVMNIIDSAILKQVLQDHAEWVSEGLDPPKMAVNLSPRRLSDPALIPGLQKLDIGSCRLSFELLESTFLDRQDPISAFNLKEIRKLGIGIAVDDFGTGYTSITGLLHVAPKILKIARELVMPLTRSREQRAIIKSIIDIGKALNIKIIAEGVETSEHIEILRDLGCDILQGFALSRPISAETTRALIRRHQVQTAAGHG